MKFEEVKYRDCGYCRTVQVAMTVQWSDRRLKDAQNVQHYWAALSCPRCGRVTLVEMSMQDDVNSGDSSISPRSDVTALRATPSGEDPAVAVSHLPDDVRGFYEDASRVLQAGVPDAAAVQLRKTLEAAAAHKGIKEKQLVSSIRKLVEEGYVTLDFKDVMTHIRQIGNSGAHYTDERLTAPEVERSLRFTTQVLRNLFEVPGELDELRREAEAADPTTKAEESVSQDETTLLI
ncbi:DUF4145 domain-containing protein [Subtercola sp. PAMC28395]|uniref:DUF4145 domain-containing protein n=1 Tax=Subtercola sp. PAMC28395 TaxID=2846775 RepID=UPI001C0CDC3C|nr:DUF4145 domain-containing protein [Subtercola sp. PAMC28395]QWT25103.1 DUF4145 domain-containing protein [Subtercola sp. PAMC28395]